MSTSPKLSLNPIFQISGKKKKLLLKTETPPLKVDQRPGGFLILTDANGVRHRIFAQENKGILSAFIDGLIFRGTITEPQYGAGASKNALSDSDLEAQFPGKITKIHVKNGAEVQAGDPLVVLVAMKMEFVIKAPKKGKIESVLVKEGDQVNVGQRFVSFKSDSSDSKGKSQEKEKKS